MLSARTSPTHFLTPVPATETRRRLMQGVFPDGAR